MRSGLRERGQTMRALAMTYPQLMNQAAAYGLDPTALLRLRTAHDLAQRLVDGVYRKEGSPFLCHLIRTGSLVLDEVKGEDLDAVVASMLHAVYFLHYFDHSTRRGPRPSDRRSIRQAVGERAERLIERYGQMRWDDEGTLRGYVRDVSRCDRDQRALLLMQLCDELEDHLDVAAAYSPHAKANRTYLSFGPIYVELALAMGHQGLAQDLEAAFDACRTAQVHDVLFQPGRRSYELRSRLWTASLIERLGAWVRRLRETRS